uniref:EF-hand domain-containing protein n=1 Tax=Alexandrium monilatum TaxID=311494 RepID=A0A7S4SUK9_9DINO
MATASRDPEVRRFKDQFCKCLSVIESCALREVEALNKEMEAMGEALANIRRENMELRNQLERQRNAVGPCSAFHVAVAHSSPLDIAACNDLHKRALDVYDVLEEAWTMCDIVPPPVASPPLRDAPRGRSGIMDQEMLSAASVGASSVKQERLLLRLGVASDSAVRRQQTSDMRVIIMERDAARQGTKAVDVYKTEGLAQRVVKSYAFEIITLCIVLINGAWIAIDLDLNGKNLVDSPIGFQLVEHLFVMAASLEMLVRFMAHRSCRCALQDRWFMLDAFLVLLMIVESWILSLVFLVTHALEMGGLGGLSALRIFRVIRVFRVARLIRFFPELMTMVDSMVGGVRSVLITLVILLIVTYGFAVCLRQLGKSTSWGDENFRSVPHSVYTLVLVSLFPDNVNLVDAIAEETWLCGLIYFMFLVLTVVMLMNMLIGILVDNIFLLSNAQKEKHTILEMSEKLHATLSAIDTDFDGMVSKTEFEGILKNHEAIRFLIDVGVDIQSLVGEVDFIFSGETTPGAGLPFEDFTDEVLKFRSSSVATNGAVAATRRFMRLGLAHLDEKLDYLLLCLSAGAPQLGPAAGPPPEPC